MSTADLVTAARNGDRRALARIISIVEDRRDGADEILESLYRYAGQAYVIGLTGAPGAGKSTLTDQLIRRIRSAGHEVGVLAVDPSSPFTGGAILGDRVRMQDHVTDTGVYVRSMGSRGHLGGISDATTRAIMLLDAVGKPFVIVETVGVGQAEVEIVDSADTTVVVVNPGWGDAIQAAKAGLLEIADVFVVNKADRPGVPETVRDLKQMLMLGAMGSWVPPIVETVGTDGSGVDELWRVIGNHRTHLEASGALADRRRARVESEIRRGLIAEVLAAADRRLGESEVEELIDEVVDRSIDPWSAARQLLED